METFLFSGIFWGIVVILWGISIILNAVFHINIPVFRILVAIFFVYLGIMILTGGFRVGKADQNTVIFGEGQMQNRADDKTREFSVIFGKGTTVISPADIGTATSYKVNAIFGDHTVQVDPKLAVRIRANSAFGSVFLPDQTVTSFGSQTYQSDSYKTGQKGLEIEASAVFGSLRVIVSAAKPAGKK